MPPGWDLERLERTVKDNMFGMSNTGICLSCGAEREGCEPDARNYECHECGEHRVFGAEEVMMTVGF